METRAENRIDWSHAAQHGLDIVKSAIEGALKDSPSQQKTAFSGDTLSRLELEGCVRESSWLDDRQIQYDAKRLQVERHRAEIDRLALEMDAARSYVDRYSQRSVDGFNAKVNNHGSRVSHFNSVVLPEIERERLSFNARIDRVNTYCNNKRYYSDDLAAVEAKLGRVKIN